MLSVGKLIPLSEYKGPILKLTPQDKKLIHNLQNRIRRRQYRLSPLEAELSTPWLPESERSLVRAKMELILEDIREFHEEIREIKVNRYEQQKLDLLV